MKVLGVVFVILGCLSLIYGGIQYRKQRTVLQVGDLRATTTEKKEVAIPPAAGVALLVVGVGLVLMDSRGAGRM